MVRWKISLITNPTISSLCTTTCKAIPIRDLESICLTQDLFNLLLVRGKVIYQVIPHLRLVLVLLLLMAEVVVIGSKTAPGGHCEAGTGHAQRISHVRVRVRVRVRRQRGPQEQLCARLCRDTDKKGTGGRGMLVKESFVFRARWIVLVLMQDD